jgi:alanine racemase
MPTRPTWAEISLDALRHNFRTLRDHVAPVAVCAVIKADAYGHGIVGCARALEAEGATWFGVTCTEEGVQLREAGIKARILLMSGFWRGEEQAVVEHDLTAAIWSREHIEALRVAAARGLAREAVHLKVDTGMSRLGAPLAELPDLCEALKSGPQGGGNIFLEGVFSHFASAEVLGAPDVREQLARFEDGMAIIARSGLTPSCQHLANSAAMVTTRDSWKSMVRPGISLYGYYLPMSSMMTGAPDVSLELPVRPVLSWKTRIIQLRDVPARTRVGYNGAFITQAPSKLATLPVGYADGLSRQLSSRGRVIVRGEFAPMVGNISMDLTSIDVTGIPGVSVGDEVILIGGSGDKKVTAWDHANLAGTIPYEVLCAISKRVPRTYSD